MAITGNWITAYIAVTPDGTIHFQAGVDLVDDALGQVGHRALTAPPEAAAQFAATLRPFMEALLPQMSAFAGMPVTIAPAPDAVVTPTPKPPISM